jgi:hypothetical protein
VLLQHWRPVEVGDVPGGYPAGEGFTSAFQASIPLAIGAFIGCALLALSLPRTAVAEAYE